MYYTKLSSLREGQNTAFSKKKKKEMYFILRLFQIPSKYLWPLIYNSVFFADVPQEKVETVTCIL